MALHNIRDLVSMLLRNAPLGKRESGLAVHLGPVAAHLVREGKRGGERRSPLCAQSRVVGVRPQNRPRLAGG